MQNFDHASTRTRTTADQGRNEGSSQTILRRCARSGVYRIVNGLGLAFKKYRDKVIRGQGRTRDFCRKGGNFHSPEGTIDQKMGKRFEIASGDRRASEFLLQRVSIKIQRGNAAAVNDSLPSGDDPAGVGNLDVILYLQ